MTADGGSGMSSEPETSDSLKTFGAVLKALREEAGLTQEQYAPRVQYSVHYIAKIEQGKRFPPDDLPVRSEPVLGLPARRVIEAAVRTLTKGAGLASWFKKWAFIEETAISLYAYECRIVPGLLQPEAYIRAAFGNSLPPLTDEQIEEQVAARLHRQKLLVEKPNVAFSFIVEQALIERGTGGVVVTQVLIDHLLELSELRNVEIQVMPLRSRVHAGLDGPIYLAETRSHEWIGYTESQKSSSLIASPAGVSALLQRYGRMRAQALGDEATVSLLEQMRGAL